MKFRVSINVSVNPYLDENDTQVSYTQGLMFNDQTDVVTENWTDLGTRIDAIATAIKTSVHER